MHYFIDGYNMLFRLVGAKDDLQKQREAIIHDLNKKISLVKLDISLIFDSTYQIGERERSHFHELEIAFTAEGETADEYILDEIKNSSHPQQEIVVTSDKGLARKARLLSAQVESIEDFMVHLNRSYKNKLRQLRKEKPLTLSASVSFSVPSPSPLPSRESIKPSLIPPKGAPLEAYTEYYARTFEAEWQEIVQQEQSRQEALPKVVKKRPPRKPKRKGDPFQTTSPGEPEAATERERWLKVFERRLNDDL
jgi:predicted RNA-binding protein with PIN domain